jgi:hypothetical protein
LPKRYQVANMNTICVTLQTNNKIERSADCLLANSR